jgi:hypothetical protein
MGEELDDGTNDFYFSVNAGLAHVYSILDEHPDAFMWIEERVDPDVVSLPGSAAGFCDVAIWVPSTGVLYIIDYKHGAGIAKDAEGNKQLLQYGSGFLFGTEPRVDPNVVSEVVLSIAQPRAFHEAGIIREHAVPPGILHNYLMELDAKIAANERPDAALTPGEEQCRFCDAKTLCPAREEHAMRATAGTFSQISEVTAPRLPVIEDMPLEKLGFARKMAPVLRKWLDDVEAHCDELARAGHTVPGAKLVETQARRNWYGTEREVGRRLAAMLAEGDHEEAVAAYEAVMDAYPVLGKVYRQQLVTITQGEKLVIEAYKARVGRKKKRAASEAAKNAFAYLTLKASSGALTLVDDTDRRPSVTRGVSSFAQITHIPGA